MRAFQRKLLRDLWGIRSQVAAILLVMAAGIALYFGSKATFSSLQSTRLQYYTEQRFADVFARALRIPNAEARRIRQLEGVAAAELRVVVDVNLDVPGMEEPAKGRLLSVPERGQPVLNRVHLRRGRWLEPGETGAAVVSEAFVDAHGLELDDRVAAVVNGRRQEYRVVGVGLSPEYVYSIGGDDLFPDPRRFGVLWVARKPLATAFDMEGGFNDVSLGLAPGASEDRVIAELDALLRPYGGLGAIPRAQQVSHWYLMGELSQLERMSVVLPTIFLLVAAFLLNVVLTRIVAVQRPQIAVLKALGYTDREVAWHYIQWALVVGGSAGLIGIAVGAWLTNVMLTMYVEYFAFPSLTFSTSPRTLIQAVGIALAAASVGAVGAVRATLRLPPAEAMRPAAPVLYHETWLERLGWRRFLDQPTRIVVRSLVRRPVRSSLSVVGVAFAVAVMFVGGAFIDAIDELILFQFDQAQRQDVTVTFTEPTSAAAVHELAQLPGVRRVEPMRSVPVRFRYGSRQRLGAITGIAEGARLQRVVSVRGGVVEAPPEGLLVSAPLLAALGAEPGDALEIEVLEGRRPTWRLSVAAALDDYIGTGAYMALEPLHARLQEGDTLSGAVLAIDSSVESDLYRELKRAPAMAGVGLRRAVLENFDTYLTENIGRMLGIIMLFAGIIAFGVVYNTARVSLSERARELGSLRVMGFRRSEISYILLTELALVVLAALPLGVVLGYLLLVGASSSLQTELYRFPTVVLPGTIGTAIATVLVAAVFSAWVVRRRLDRLDLVAVLKVRE